MHDALLASDIDFGQLIGLVAVGGGMLIAVVAIIAGITKSVMMNKHREESRREISAYVAEGSMTAEEGERLLKAGPKRGWCDS